MPTRDPATDRDPPIAPEPIATRHLRLLRNVRRGAITLLAVFVGAGALGFFGVRSATVTAEAGGYRLTVTFASVTRPALATPWAVEVRRAGGFDGKVTVATTATYFELFDENGLHPDPASATTDGDLLVWEFDPPEGDVLRLSYDARIGPDVQTGKSARTVVIVGGRELVEVSYRTRVMP